MKIGDSAVTTAATSGYDAPVTLLLLAGSVEDASNPTYGDFHGNHVM